LSGVHVLVTGASGFIGSSLAARLLDRGTRVTCLARGEDGPVRTRRAIAEAAAGFGFDVDPARVEVLPYDFGALESRHGSAIADLDAVWHCAAHMTFNMKKLRDALDFNVGGTVAFVETLSRACRKRPRFYYVSTAYTGGVEATSIGETLHLAPHLVNPYFVSKWATELVLEKLARDGVLPVTVHRPTLVTGHAETGWYGGESYGLYNFLDAVWGGRLAGAHAMRLDIDPRTLHNYVPIDDVVYNAIALTELKTGRESFEVVIAEGTDNPNSDRTAWIAEGLGLDLSLGRPRTVADHVVDRWIAVNKPFNQPEAGVRPFPFESGKLERMLGSSHRKHVLDRAIHLLLVRWYREKRLVPLDGQVLGDPAVRAVRAANAIGLEGALPKKIAGGLVARAVARAHGLM
jgi:nucleoside-diphosphate-sugar epimerase